MIIIYKIKFLTRPKPILTVHLILVLFMGHDRGRLDREKVIGRDASRRGANQDRAL